MYYVANPVGLWLFESFDDAYDFALDGIHDCLDASGVLWSNTTVGCVGSVDFASISW